MPTGKKIEKWEKEFDDEFKGENEFKNGDYIVEDQAIYIKNFISDLLSSQLKEVLKIINSFKLDTCETVECGYNGDKRYNQALDDLRAELTKLEETNEK